MLKEDSYYYFINTKINFEYLIEIQNEVWFEEAYKDPEYPTFNCYIHISPNHLPQQSKILYISDFKGWALDVADRTYNSVTNKIIIQNAIYKELSKEAFFKKLKQLKIKNIK